MALARQRFAHARRQLRLLLGGRARIDRYLAFGFARHSSYTLLGWVARAMVRSSRSPAGASRSPGGASRVERQRYPLVFRARRCALTGAKGVGSAAPRNPSRRSAPTPRSIDRLLSPMRRRTIKVTVRRILVLPSASSQMSATSADYRFESAVTRSDPRCGGREPLRGAGGLWRLDLGGILAPCGRRSPRGLPRVYTWYAVSTIDR